MAVAYAGDWPAKLWGLFPRARHVTRVHGELAILSPGSPRLRVAFMSDMHVGPTTHEVTLQRAVELVNEAAPDVVLLGGDFVFLDATDRRASTVERLLGRLAASTKVAVLGNHDLWTDYEKIERALARAGVTVLTNRSVVLPAPHHEVAVVGIDDPESGHPDPTLALESCGAARVRVGLCHSPDGLALAGDLGLSLLLCGHTHGGQMATPWGPVFVPGKLGHRYPSGLHRVDDLHLFVSRGIGGVSLPTRTWAPPDVGVFDLLPAGVSARGR